MSWFWTLWRGVLCFLWICFFRFMLDPRVTGQKGQGCTFVWSVLFGMNGDGDAPPPATGRLLEPEFGFRCLTTVDDIELGVFDLTFGCISPLMLRAASLCGEETINCESEHLIFGGSIFISKPKTVKLKICQLQNYIKRQKQRKKYLKTDLSKIDSIPEQLKKNIFWGYAFYKIEVQAYPWGNRAHFYSM